MANGKILTADQEMQLRQPIDDYVGKIQKKIDGLRVDGTDRVVSLQNTIDNTKRDRTLTKGEKENRISALKAEVNKAKAVEAKNRGQISGLIADAEAYLKAHYDKEYYQPVKASCEAEKVVAKEKCSKKLLELEKEHKQTMSGLSDHQEIKDEKYVYRNRQFDAKMDLQKDLQQIKDRRHAAYTYKYHLIDMLRMSRFTFAESQAQRWENYRYTFNRRNFLLQNGLYIAIIIIFIALCIITPMVKGSPLLTYNNVLNILQQASPRMFLALGVAALILLAGTDLSIGRMVGMGMTTATIIMHQGINTGGVFGHIFDFTGVPVVGRIILALAAVYHIMYILYNDRGILHSEVQDASVYFHDGEHACDLRTRYICDKGCIFRRDRADDPEHDHPETQRIPDHHPVGGGSGNHCMVHLE